MLQIETWWLFALPIVFALGWVGARWDMRLEKRENEIERLAQQKSTFKGLNLLLNEEPDKAIDALVQIAQLDPETTELHFALGSLFSSIVTGKQNARFVCISIWPIVMICRQGIVIMLPTN